jgi:hypothetical protein
MSQEHLPKTPEHGKEHEHGHEGKSHEKLKETIEKGHEAKHEAKDSLEAIRSSIDKHAEAGKHKHEEAVEAQTKRDAGPAVIDRTVKKKAYKKELHRVQSHLPKGQKAFSKLIHSSAVETASEIGGKTVARPSGLLGGGIAALLGSGALVIVSRHYGFSYNFFVFIAFLIAGFFVGLIIELIVRALLKAKS